MKTLFIKTALVIIILTWNKVPVWSQLSPGPLSASHSALEGISNCTKCHEVGNRISGEKCLSCHIEIDQRIKASKGYHASAAVRGKECFACHVEHNGKEYNLLRLETATFNHDLTGYPLSVPHSKHGCRACHIPSRITDPSLRSKKTTYLGLGRDCLVCHEDYHRQTLPADCLGCHDPGYFSPATRFDHSNARFKLNGSHRNVACNLCHKSETFGGKKFQEFRGLAFSGCADCHRDPHESKFGPDCRKCHSEVSFTAVKNVNGFDHNVTGFRLEGRHSSVACNLCHKKSLTEPLKHDRCTSCHPDYHEKQFIANGMITDCIECHSVTGFTETSYSIAQHSLGKFRLSGSHEATACIDCHKKTGKWNFRNIGFECIECHTDVHSGKISSKYYPGGNCRACHTETRWADITAFEHSATGFSLTGGHTTVRCNACHFSKKDNGSRIQKFSELTGACTDCHMDNHSGQFAENGVTLCTRCHTVNDWSPSGFNHNATAFKLDGEHAGLPCNACHKPQKEGSVSFVNFTIKDFRCESCHY